MRKLIKPLLALLSTMALASCGGGGGSSDNSAFNPQGIRVTIEATTTATTPNSLVGFTVRAVNPNGAPVPDQTLVNVVLTPPGLGFLSVVRPAAIQLNEQVQVVTLGGTAGLRFHAKAIGTAIITASVVDPANGSNRVVTATSTITVAAGPPSDPRIRLIPTATSIPVNVRGVVPFVGSPYSSTVSIEHRDLLGAFVDTGDDQFGVNIAPISVAAFSTLDDPETEDINEIQVLLGNGPVDGAGGGATVLVHSFNAPGSATLTVTARDPVTNEVVSAQQTFNVVTGAPQVPASVVIGTDGLPIYIQGVNGNTSNALEIFVFDGVGAPVPNPPAGTNNIRLELVGGSSAGERLTGTNAAGNPVSGATITLRSFNGIGNAAFQSGTRAGRYTLRATSDRADNNIDNGIADPITSTRLIDVSDGRVFDIELTGPTQNALTINPVTPGVAPTPGSTVTIPPSPDGSYSLTISAIATDRAGNPVPPGTTIRFGLVDAPQQDGFGPFLIGGTDGNPLESGTVFTAPAGAFTTAGGGVGPNDTLLVFGEDSVGNRDLESSRIVQSVQGPGALTVTRRFNANDDTGTTVDNGPVLPYVIGRAVDGNITAQATTNDIGLARVTMNYPVSKLGKPVLIWAQADGDIPAGATVPELVSDVEGAVFAGVAPALLTAEPSRITGNRTVPIRVCLFDFLRAPIRGATIGFRFENLGGGSGTVDGVSGSGTVAQRTGADGCTIATAVTTGITVSGGRLVFSAGTSANEAPVLIDVGGTPVLSASPTALPVPTAFCQVITLRYTDAGGAPIANAAITGNCTASGAGASLGLIGLIAPTDASGLTSAVACGCNFVIPGATATAPTTFNSGTCTFRAPAGPTAETRFQGAISGTPGVSPAPPPGAGC
jgi:hypothetical protein